MTRESHKGSILSFACFNYGKCVPKRNSGVIAKLRLRPSLETKSNNIFFKPCSEQVVKILLFVLLFLFVCFFREKVNRGGLSILFL